MTGVPLTIDAAARTDIQDDNFRFCFAEQHAKIADPQSSTVHTEHFRDDDYCGLIRTRRGLDFDAASLS
jgi:hypothetical protein